MEIKLKISERAILNKIKEEQTRTPYDFWFVYTRNGRSIGYEGGVDLNNYSNRFRNQYTLLSDGTIRCNWEDQT